MTAFTWNGSFPSSPSTGDTLLMNDMTYTRTSLGTWEVTGGAAITATGALNSGSITSGFGTINNGASTITTTGALGSGALTATTIAGTTGTFSGDLMTGVTSTPSAGEAGTYLSAAGYTYSSRAGTTKAPHFLMTNNNGTAGSLSSSGTGELLISSGTGNTTALTLDNSQNATFAGAATVSGGLNVVGTNNTTSTLLLSNTSGTDNNWSFVPAYNAQTLAILAASTTVLTLNENKSATFAGDVSTTAGSLTIADAGSTLASFTRTSRGAFEIKQGTSLNGWTTGTLLEVNTEGLVIQAATQINLSSDGGTTRTLYLDNSSNATFAGNIIRKATPNGSVGGFAISDNGTGPIIAAGDTGTTLNTLYDFFNGNGIVGKIQTNGSGTSYVTSSDYRLKENVVTEWDATTRLKQLKPSRFNFIADADTTVDGFLAHEAQEVVPECVTGLKDAIKDEEYEVSAATGEVFTPAIEEVTTETQVMETVETGSYVNLAGETIVETEQRGVTTETTETVVQRQDIDGVSTEVQVEVTTQVPTMKTVITTAAVAETVHSTDVEQPDTLEDGQQWRETTAQVMATRSVPDYQGIDQGKLVPLLVKTIQELEARITALEA